MLNVLDPALAALAAAFVGVTGPVIPAPPPMTPATCGHWSSFPSAAGEVPIEQIRKLVDELITRARDEGRAARLDEGSRETPHATLPPDPGAVRAARPDSGAGTCDVVDGLTMGVDVGLVAGADGSGAAPGVAQAGLETAAATRLADRIVASIAAAGLTIPPAAGGDEGDGDDNDDEGDGGGSAEGGSAEGGSAEGGGGDGGGGAAVDVIPSPPAAPITPAPPADTQPGLPTPGVPEPTPGSAPAVRLALLMRELATTLSASTDPAMRRLGDELAGILAGGAGGDPVPTLPAPSATPGLPATSSAPDAPAAADAPGQLARPTTGSAHPSVLPSGTTPLFIDDFEGGDLGKWGSCQGAGVNGDCAGLTVSDGMGVGQDPERGMVAQFRITDGKEAEMGGERSEVRDSGPGTSVQEGDHRWYSWSMKFPEDFPEPDGGYYIVMQWHQSNDSGSPPLALDVSKGTIDIGGDGVEAPRQTVGRIRRGEWVNYVLHAKFSQSDGFVEAWENGQQTVQKTSRPTMTDGENYLKMGIYRDPDATGDAEVWFDDFAVHDGAGGTAPAPVPTDRSAPDSGTADHHHKDNREGGRRYGRGGRRGELR